MTKNICPTSIESPDPSPVKENHSQEITMLSHLCLKYSTVKTIHRKDENMKITQKPSYMIKGGATSHVDKNKRRQISLYPCEREQLNLV